MVADGEAGAQVLAEPMPAAQGGNNQGSFSPSCNFLRIVTDFGGQRRRLGSPRTPYTVFGEQVAHKIHQCGREGEPGWRSPRLS
jgi:hypothetical protein